MDQIIGGLVAVTVISVAVAVTSVINALSAERQLAAALKRNAEMVTITGTEIRIAGRATLPSPPPVQD